MHGFHQGAQFPQHEHPHLTKASRIQPCSQTGGQFGGHVSDTIQQQLGFSQRQSGVQDLPLEYANPQQQPPPSGQLTREFQGIIHVYARQEQSNSLHANITMIMVVLRLVLEFGAHVFYILPFIIYCFDWTWAAYCSQSLPVYTSLFNCTLHQIYTVLQGKRAKFWNNIVKPSYHLIYTHKPSLFARIWPVLHIFSCSIYLAYLRRAIVISQIICQQPSRQLEFLIFKPIIS